HSTNPEPALLLGRDLSDDMMFFNPGSLEMTIHIINIQYFQSHFSRQQIFCSFRVFGEKHRSMKTEYLIILSRSPAFNNRQFQSVYIFEFQSFPAKQLCFFCFNATELQM